ncbi:hypothetical protein ELE36_00430 [Pseudolysobacter antarcticus]|uniref:UPF0225 protein ELE36_00430 n=1 Tax=Pseudolysobacter antarcticus TaxID=2511995 RepID=A0A411HET3_9GAMM|nr:YchJ family metal-binding protein [Pseudolysobacter antarcticus]QBB68964.1 hypothetical protein ELE36_00430 [Pseudolysobacter antarcticus]
MNEQFSCPCTSGKPYSKCCQPWHDGAAASDAEALMRSRYSAYVVRLQSYLVETCHSSTRPISLDLDQGNSPMWLGLEIKRHEQTGPATALVEFVARFRVAGGSAQRLHEISRFVLEAGRWYYLDGVFPRK